MRALVGETAHLAADALGRAAREQHIGRTLRHDRNAELPLEIRLDGAHQLSLRRERQLTHALESRCAGRVQPGDLRLGDQECRLRRIALDRPLPVLLPQNGVVREAPSHQQRAHLIE